MKIGPLLRSQSRSRGVGLGGGGGGGGKEKADKRRVGAPEAAHVTVSCAEGGAVDVRLHRLGVRRGRQTKVLVHVDDSDARATATCGKGEHEGSELTLSNRGQQLAPHASWRPRECGRHAVVVEAMAGSGAPCLARQLVQFLQEAAVVHTGAAVAVHVAAMRGGLSVISLLRARKQCAKESYCCGAVHRNVTRTALHSRQFLQGSAFLRTRRRRGLCTVPPRE